MQLRVAPGVTRRKIQCQELLQRPYDPRPVDTSLGVSWRMELDITTPSTMVLLKFYLVKSQDRVPRFWLFTS